MIDGQITVNERFIPAPAGNGIAAPNGQRRMAVHPRACGERPNHYPPALWILGSSPRLRGTGAGVVRVSSVRRFIPAPAGNGWRLRQGSVLLPVHPRACGERQYPLNAGQVFIGSSPRLRGTAGLMKKGDNYDRFIPAPAGNGVLQTSWRGIITVHPRACGERRSSRNIVKCLNGSSPRLRGTVEVLVQISAQDRFIPAPAGNGCSTSET